MTNLRTTMEMLDDTLPDAGPHAAPDASLFLLRAPLRGLETTGCLTRLPSGPTDTLGERVRAFFAQRSAGPTLLVGALPFDPHAQDALFQPAAFAEAAIPAAMALPPVQRLAAEPTAAAYADAVASALQHLRADGDALRKTVLARSLHAELAGEIDPRALASRLALDPNVATYVAPLTVADGESHAWLVGATPELLVSRRGLEVTSYPLAGSARRSADPDEDARIAQGLLASTKDLDEHGYVVDAIVAALSPLCGSVDAPERPTLTATATMWHLGTRISGRLKDSSVSAAALAGLLHPTPAVCGTPRELALQTIRELEPVDRGFYAGAVGWVDAEGDGDWYVAIRCARAQGNALRLFAGAGIVRDSQPQLEVEETAAKFGALLNALGIDPAQAL